MLYCTFFITTKHFQHGFMLVLLFKLPLFFVDKSLSGPGNAKVRKEQTGKKRPRSGEKDAESEPLITGTSNIVNVLTKAKVCLLSPVHAILSAYIARAIYLLSGVVQFN